MAIAIDTREVGDVVILDISGQSSLMDGTILQQTVRRLLHEERRYFLLNLAGLRHLDSFGLGQFVATYISVRDHHGDMWVVNPNSSIRDLFKYTRLDTVLQILPSEEEGIRELRQK